MKKFEHLNDSNLSNSKYIYLKKDNQIEFDDFNYNVKSKFEIDNHSLAILMDSGVVPSPKTLFKNLYLLNYGDKIYFNPKDDSVLDKSEFLYFRDKSKQNRLSIVEFEKILTNAVRKCIPPENKSILFLSGGKDSASIACALKEAELSDNCTCITYRSKKQDETLVAKKITKKLGISHQILDINSYKIEPKIIESFFSGQLLPSLDLCSTLYLHCNLIDHTGSTLIDGMGNDIYMGHIPSRKEHMSAFASEIIPNWLKSFMNLFHRINSAFMIGSKTRSEMVGMWSFLTSSELVDELLPYNVRREFWREIDEKNKSFNYIDLRASMRGRYIDQEKFIRKIKNAASYYGLRLALPWMDKDLTEYCFNLSNDELYDSDSLTNKILIRKYLSKKLDINYFNEPKYTFSYNYSQFVKDNIEFISDLILTNSLFDRKKTSTIFHRALKFKNYGFIYQLFLLLGWHTFSLYIKK